MGRVAVAAVIARHDWAAPLAKVLRGLWTDAYVVGWLSSGAVLAHHSTGVVKADDPSVATVTLGVDWAGWAPGDTDAAKQILGRDDALGHLLSLVDTGGEVADSIVVSRMDRLARTLIDGLEQGLAPATIATQLQGILGDARWAHLVALTETTRAVSAATLARYARNGIAAKEWMTAGDQHVCVPCNVNEDVGAIPLEQSFPDGNDAPPSHPLCRCAIAPAWLTAEEASAAGADLTGLLPAGGFGEAELAGIVTREAEDILAEAEQETAARQAAPGSDTPAQIAAAQAVEIRQALKDAKTIKEISKAFADEAEVITGRRIPADFGIHAIDVASPLTAREHAEGILRVLERFPDMTLDLVTWVKYSDRTIFAEAELGTIRFEMRYAADRPAYLRALAKGVEGWKNDYDWRSSFSFRGSANPVATAVHEMGHVLDLDTIGQTLAPRVEALVEDMAQRFNLPEDSLIRRQVSSYATTNTTELIAEAFGDTVLNGEAASELSRGIFGLIVQEYEAGNRVYFTAAELDEPGTGWYTGAAPKLATPEVTAARLKAINGIPSTAPRQLRAKIAAELARQAELLPDAFLSGDLTRVEIADEAKWAQVVQREHAGAWASYSVNDHAIYLHPDWATAAGRRAIDASMKKAFVDDHSAWSFPGYDYKNLDTAGAVIRHEMGHVVSDSMLARDLAIGESGRVEVLGTVWTDALRTRLIEPLAEELYVAAPASTDAIDAWFRSREVQGALTRYVSAYAAETPREALAELWSVYTGRGEEASSIAKRIGGIIQDRWERLRAPVTVPEPVAADVSRMTATQLRAEAKARGLTGYSKLTKPQLLDLLGGDVEGAAVSRQVEIDAARNLADTLAEVHELVANEASERALTARITARAKLTGVDVSSLLAKVGDREALLAEADRMAAAANLTRVGEVATREVGPVPFNRAAHELLGPGLEPGAAVDIIRPGYTVRLRSGEELAVRRPVVLESTRPLVRVEPTSTAAPLTPAEFDAAIKRAASGDAVKTSVRFGYSEARAETTVSAGLSDLSAAQRARIGESAALYQGGFSDSISGYLREALTPETGGQRIAEAVEDLRLATERSALRSATVAWRGITSGEAILDAVDPAFLSLSTDRAVAERYAGDALLRILLPKGSPAALLSPEVGEAELLTSPGWTLRVVRDNGRVAINGGREVRLLDVQAVPPTAKPTTVTTAVDERAALRAAARERNRQIEAATGTERLLAEVDELLAKKASLDVIRESLAPGLTEAGQVFAGADAKVLAALQRAADTGDVAKVRSAVTRQSTATKLKIEAKAGTKVSFDPALHESVGGVDIAPGTKVVVVRRGASVTLPDGTVLELTKPQVRTLPPPEPRRPPAPESLRTPGRDMAAEVREGETWLRRAEMDQQFGQGYDEVLTTLVRRQDGWSDPARVVTPTEMDRVVKSGWTEMWRGVQDWGPGNSAREIAERTRIGKWEMGNGIYGNGVYTTERRTTAEIYRGSEFASTNFHVGPHWGPAPLYEWLPGFEVQVKAGMMRLALDPAANIVDYEELHAEHIAYLRSVDYRNMPDSAYKRTMEDSSAYAVSRGYDGVKIEGPMHNDGAEYPEGVANRLEPPQYIIFNRTVLIFEKASRRYDT